MTTSIPKDLSLLEQGPLSPGEAAPRGSSHMEGQSRDWAEKSYIIRQPHVLLIAVLSLQAAEDTLGTWWFVGVRVHQEET